MADTQLSWRLGALQMCSGTDVGENQYQVEQILKDLPPHPGDLVLLPENFAQFGITDNYRAVAEQPGDGPIQNWLSCLAKNYQITLIAGSLPTRVTGKKRCRNTSLVFDPDGRCISHYHKLHLFDVDIADSVGQYRESDQFISGEQPKWFKHQQVGVGLSICFDLRFSYLYHWLRQQGCMVLLVPAAFTEQTGRAHWMTLLKARAIEQQCYVVAAAQVGDHGGGRQTWGHSCIIDPWGHVMAELGKQIGICYGKFEVNSVLALRKRMLLQPHPHLDIRWSK